MITWYCLLFGNDARIFVVELQDIFLMGDYIELAKPVKSDSMQYVSYHNYHNVLNSGNDHQNLNLNLSMVNNLYHNFIPSALSNNYNYVNVHYLINLQGQIMRKLKLRDIQLTNRSALRFRLNFAVDETVANTNKGISDN